MYGYPIPQDYKEAMEFDKQNGNNKWREAIDTEMGQLNSYQTFIDLGLNADILNGYKSIRTHLVFCVKHSGKFKARMVADGHWTDRPLRAYIPVLCCCAVYAWFSSSLS
jgi:hypothetical protein